MAVPSNPVDLAIWRRTVAEMYAADRYADEHGVASLALMAVVTWQLATVALVDAITVALALAAAFLLFRYRTNSAWLVIGGAAAGILKSFV